MNTPILPRGVEREPATSAPTWQEDNAGTPMAASRDAGPLGMGGDDAINGYMVRCRLDGRRLVECLENQSGAGRRTSVPR